MRRFGGGEVAVLRGSLKAKKEHGARKGHGGNKGGERWLSRKDKELWLVTQRRERSLLWLAWRNGTFWKQSFKLPRQGQARGTLLSTSDLVMSMLFSPYHGSLSASSHSYSIWTSRMPGQYVHMI
jgi:hypothetical protein